jgi:hypothetical protein
MKYLMIIFKHTLKIMLICIVLFLTNCSEGITGDQSSLHSYFIDNQSSAIIRLKYTLRFSDLEEETYSPDIQPGIDERFHTYTNLGVGAVDPSFEFYEVKIFIVVSETETLVYTQNPMDDSLWVYYEYGSSFVYTLTITNSDLGL